MDKDLLNKVYGYDIAKTEELNLLLNAQMSEDTNPNSKYFVKVRKEITELIQFINEIKQEKEDE